MMTMLISTLKNFLNYSVDEVFTNFILKARELDLEIACGDSFVWIKNPNSKVMLVSHADTIKRSDKFELIENDYVLKANMSVLGGDDRCGCAAIYDLLGVKNINVLITNFEESGCLGAHEFVDKLSKDLIESNVNALIEFDRRGVNQYVVYSNKCKELQELAELKGLKEEYGSLSDVKIITASTKIAHINMSAGYYNEHSIDEFVDKMGWIYQCTKLESLVDDINNSETRFSPIENTYTQTNYYSDFDKFVYKDDNDQLCIPFESKKKEETKNTEEKVDKRTERIYEKLRFVYGDLFFNKHDIKDIAAWYAWIPFDYPVFVNGVETFPYFNVWTGDCLQEEDYVELFAQDELEDSELTHSSSDRTPGFQPGDGSSDSAMGYQQTFKENNDE